MWRGAAPILLCLACIHCACALSHQHAQETVLTMLPGDQAANSSNGSNVTEPVGCPGNCTGHGTCSVTECFCDPGWEGLDCATQDHFYSPCPKRMCFYNTTVLPINTSVGIPFQHFNSSNLTCVDCSGHGVCAPPKDENSTFGCNCTKGYYGPGCEIGPIFCPKDFNCSHGKCSVGPDDDDKEGFCRCEERWGDYDCNTELWKCPNDCSEHGKCLKDLSSPTKGRCKCIEGKTGDDCSFDVFDCPKHFNCSGHGKCIEGKCQCRDMFYGFDCSLKRARCPKNFDCGHHGECVDGVCSCHPGWMGIYCLHRKDPYEPWKRPASDTGAAEPSPSPTAKLIEAAPPANGGGGSVARKKQR